MSDMLIRNIDSKLKREIEKRARAHGRSLSEEAKAVLRKGLDAPESERKMGTWMASLVRPEDRGDDLVFEYRGEISTPPDFE
jgi:plasmid stability protein